jgi:NAD(P)-dependent dehydrogenase (short-subunit alcohol dehydrogenase family)
LHHDLTGKVAQVTGGSRGIGTAVARALASAGADVAITYLNSRQAAENVAAEMRATGVRARAVRADQADPAAAAAVVRQVAGEACLLYGCRVNPSALLAPPPAAVLPCRIQERQPRSSGYAGP